MSPPDLAPHDPDAEVAVLSSMLAGSTPVRQVLDILTPSDFYIEENRVLFRAIDDVAQDDEDVDVALVVALLKEQGTFERVGGIKFIERLLGTRIFSANAGIYATTVRDLARKREVVLAARRYEAASRNGHAEEAWADLVQARERMKPGPAADTNLQRWDFASQIDLPEPPPPDLLVDLVFTRPGVHIIFGPPGSGKSFALLQLALDLVMGGGAFMGAEELQIRARATPTGSFEPPPREKCLWLFGSEDSSQRMDLRSRKVFRSGPHAGKEVPEDSFVYMTPPDDIFLGTPAGSKWLSDTIAREKPTILVLDTVASLASDKLAIDKADQVSGFLRTFHRLRDNERITTFLVHHTRKSGTDPRKSSEAQADNMLGSQAWRSLSDGVLMIHAVDGDTQKVTAKLVKGKDLDSQMPTILFTLERDWARFRPLEEDEVPEVATKVGRPAKCSAEAVLTLRKDHPGVIVWDQMPALLSCSPRTWKDKKSQIQTELLTNGHVVVDGMLVWMTP